MCSLHTNIYITSVITYTQIEHEEKPVYIDCPGEREGRETKQEIDRKKE